MITLLPRVAKPGFFSPLMLMLLFWASFQAPAAVPPPEKLLPDDTLFVATVPDFNKAREWYGKSAQLQLWNDPAMKPFKEKFLSRWNEEFVQPLERDLNLKFADLANLLQGQLTVAVTRNGWQGKGDSDDSPGLVVLLDTREKSSQLQTNLADLRKRYVDARKPLRIEKIRGLEFLALSASSNDLPKTLQKFFPPRLQTRELGDDETAPQKTRSGRELLIGQAESLLIIGDSPKVLEKVVIRLGGGAVPALGEQAAFSGNHEALFRDAPAYAWLNARVLVEILTRLASEKKENPAAPKPDKLMSALGLGGLKTLAVSLRASDQGTLVHALAGVPEASRQGLLKILAGEPKESVPPPFVPADALKFRRWRLDGQKAWATLEKMLAEASPQSLNALNFLLDTVDTAARDKDPGFDIRKSFIGNLGDDLISFEKAAREGAPPGQDGGPSIYLLGSPDPQRLAAALKNLLILSGIPEEREFLGRKIYSLPLPNIPLPSGPVRRGPPSTLNFAASASYVAFSTDVALLEEYLRSAESQSKTLREKPGLTEASQKVIGPGTSMFGYQNQTESMRAVFQALKKNPASPNAISGLSLLSGIPGFATPERSFRDMLDFSLLPEFEQVAKYFHFTVHGMSATSEGLSYKAFSPTPPQLNRPAGN
jgi:hypothetical protein